MSGAKVDRCAPLSQLIGQNNQQIIALKGVFKNGTPSEKADAKKNIDLLEGYNKTLQDALRQCQALPDGPRVDN